jgi:hypothetical protein
MVSDEPPSYQESQLCQEDEEENQRKKKKSSDDCEHQKALGNLKRVVEEIREDDGDLYSTDGEYEEDQKFEIKWSKIPYKSVNCYSPDETIEELREKVSRVEFMIKSLLNIVILDVCRRGENSLDVYEIDCLSSRILAERNFQNCIAAEAVEKLKKEYLALGSRIDLDQLGRKGMCLLIIDGGIDEDVSFNILDHLNFLNDCEGYQDLLMNRYIPRLDNVE